MTDDPYETDRHRRIRERASRAGLSDQDPCFRILPRSRSRFDAELSNGDWIILAAATWSGYDQQAIDVAANLVRRLPSTLTVGIWSFEGYEEIEAAFPEIDREREVGGITPIWIFTKAGRVDRFYLGPHLGPEGEERLLRRIEGWLAGEPKEFPPGDIARIVAWIRSLWTKGTS